VPFGTRVPRLGPVGPPRRCPRPLVRLARRSSVLRGRPVLHRRRPRKPSLAQPLPGPGGAPRGPSFSMDQRDPPFFLLKIRDRSFNDGRDAPLVKPGPLGSRAGIETPGPQPTVWILGPWPRPSLFPRGTNDARDGQQRCAPFGASHPDQYGWMPTEGSYRPLSITLCDGSSG